MKHLHRYLILALLAGLAACASVGTPQGGPKDETPPVLLGTKPAQKAVNYHKKKIEISFDENVNVTDASEKVIISPPQTRPATVSAILKKIVVELEDSLRSDMTYTIDFTDAIVDYNEGNPFGNYTFSFSTGSEVDTFELAGLVLDASNLSPVKGLVVGVYTEMDDSTFLRDPFLRVAKTDEDGHFAIKGLKPQPYHVFALNDQNHDNHFDQRGEGIAFPDSAVTPWSEICQRYDTVWQDTATIDTVRLVDYTCYKPDNLLLSYFLEDFGRQYLAKSERPLRHQFQLYFGYKAESLPKLQPLLPDSVTLDSLWFELEATPTLDTLTYWITDSDLIRLDTLWMQIDYLKTDSTDQLAWTRDTLQLRVKKEASGKKDKKKDDKKDSRGKRDKKEDSAPADSVQAPPPVVHLKNECKLSGTVDIYSVPAIVWETPILELADTAWHLYGKKDTLWIPMHDFDLEQDGYNPRRCLLYADWLYGGEYKLEIDSGCIQGIYGLSNDKFSQSFKIKEEKEYSRLRIEIDGLEGRPAFVELLDKSDKPVRKEPVENGVADCMDLQPGDYYVRLVLDLNDDYLWTTGCYGERRQPEPVFYMDKKLTLKANWEINETWNIHELPLEKQKPDDLKESGDSKKGSGKKPSKRP